MWERAIDQAKAKYPNVQVVSDQPGNYDPRVALRVIGDALRAHPDIDVVISPWDDMTRGAEQAIVAAGEKPGKDVRIYSTGATKVGVQRVKQGAWNETSIFLPFEESYYAAVALMMAFEGKPVNAYVNEAEMPAVTKLGSIYVTKQNAAQVPAELLGGGGADRVERRSASRAGHPQVVSRRPRTARCRLRPPRRRGARPCR